MTAHDTLTRKGETMKEHKMAARISAKESATKRCPTCGATPLRQVGDPRSDARGWEYRKRACAACGWVGIELRAIMSPTLATIVAEMMATEAVGDPDAEQREFLALMEA